MTSRIHRPKEIDQLQRVRKENEKLKRENSKLRKQLARIDLDRHSYVRDIVEEHYENEKNANESEKLIKDLKHAWACLECGNGFLEIILYNKRDQTWYFRHCSNCTHRTKSQAYNPNVSGIFKKSTEETSK